MINLWMMRFDSAALAPVLATVASNSDFRISLATANNDNYGRVKSLLGDSTELLNSISLLRTPVGPEWSIADMSDAQYADQYYYFAQQNMERNEARVGDLPFADRNYLIFCQREYWKKKLVRNKPDVVVFSITPHVYYELVLVALLREMKIPCVYLFQAVGRAHAFLDSDFNPITTNKSIGIKEALSEKIDEVRRMEKWQEDLKTQKVGITRLFQALSRSLGSMVLRPFTRYRKGYYLRVRASNRLLPNSTAFESMQEIRFLFNILAMRAYYSFSCWATSKRKGAKYVFFPLASHFEATIHPIASPLTLEIAIKSVHDRLSDGQVLVIKEHPVQFTFRHHQRFARTAKFYRSITKLPRVKLVRESSNSLELMKNAELTVCMSSSSSLIESLTLGTPVQYVGRLPYVIGSSTSGVIRNLDDLEGAALYKGGWIMDENRDSLAISENLIATIRTLLDH